MKCFRTDQFDLPLPAGHPFPMAKYARLRKQIHDDSSVSDADMPVAEAADEELLTLAHDPVYVRRVIDGTLTEREMRRIGFPWSQQLVERSRRTVGATVAAARAALTDGVAVNLAGGTHHATTDSGQGYCVLNDTAVALYVLRTEHRVDEALVVDCDAHQGNGTAQILAGDRSAFTFSIHARRGFPLRTHAGDLDIALADGTGDRDYLSALSDGLRQCFASITPKVVFYLAGADPFAGDRWGRLKLTKEGLARRDGMVLEHCHRAQVPVAISMAGGYADDVADVVDIHAQTIHTARRIVLQ